VNSRYKVAEYAIATIKKPNKGSL